VTRLVAIVPMRHESVRVRGKNYRELGGKPLYHHVVQTLLASPAVDEVVIDTDSRLIMQDAAVAFPAVRIVERPAELAGGEVPMNDVLLHTVTQVTADRYLQTHSTNPLLRTATVTGAVRAFDAGAGEHDSLFSVTRIQKRLWSVDGRPLNHDPAVLLRTQDLEGVFEENSCVYIFTRESLESRRNRIGERPLLFEIEREEAWDIDDEWDFRVVETLQSLRSAGQ
jgi:CMP-N-acetylneuraminic acid synthetase